MKIILVLIVIVGMIALAIHQFNKKSNVNNDGSHATGPKKHEQ